MELSCSLNETSLIMPGKNRNPLRVTVPPVLRYIPGLNVREDGTISTREALKHMRKLQKDHPELLQLLKLFKK
jgi:hypothetical protein